MIFRPFYAFDTGCAAYVLGCGGEGIGAAVDPREDQVQELAAFAAAKGLRLAWVIDTHVHADHRSGGPALARLTGARYALHEAAAVTASFTPLVDDQELVLGNTRVRVLHTPGHTPESICLLVTDLRRGPAPWFLLTGDTLFSGAVGRPDLPGHAAEQAALLHQSLHGRLLALPDDLEVHPAHFAGSACGVGLSGKPNSTLGFERRWNPLLSLGREAFVAAVTAAPPPAPPAEILAANRGAP